MNNLSLSLIAPILFLLAVPVAAQELRESDALSPSDIGASKFLFEASAPKGQVVVFRAEERQDAKLVNRYDVISNTLGEKKTQSVLILDQGLLLRRGEGAGFIVRYAGATRILEGARYKGGGHQSTSPRLTASFETPDRKLVELTFSICIEPYEAAKARVQALPDDTQSKWTYAHSYDDNER